jgi:hypothetical protein
MNNDCRDEWNRGGPAEAEAREETIPAFIQIAPDDFKPVEQCSADELMAAAGERLLQARELMDEGHRLMDLAEETRH